jgi:hypothetical protein
MVNMDWKKAAAGDKIDVGYRLPNGYLASRRRNSAVNPGVIARSVLDARYKTTYKGLSRGGFLFSRSQTVANG